MLLLTIFLATIFLLASQARSGTQADQVSGGRAGSGSRSKGERGRSEDAGACKRAQLRKLVCGGAPGRRRPLRYWGRVSPKGYAEPRVMGLQRETVAQSPEAPPRRSISWKTRTRVVPKPKHRTGEA